MKGFCFLICAVIALVSGSPFCPDRKTQCSKSQTCCQMTTGLFGCCPYQNATCCDGADSCCPHGTQCDVIHSRCIAVQEKEHDGWTMIYNSFTQEEWNAQNLVEDNGENYNVTSVNKSCGAGEQTCPDSYTCCKLVTGGFGCCPFNSATCCPDQIHCCPHGKTCDDKGKRCV